MKEGYTRLLSMTFDGYVFGFEGFASSVELAGDVVRYMGVHVGLTICSYISCLPLSMVRCLICLMHRK